MCPVRNKHCLGFNNFRWAGNLFVWPWIYIKTLTVTHSLGRIKIRLYLDDKLLWQECSTMYAMDKLTKTICFLCSKPSYVEIMRVFLRWGSLIVTLPFFVLDAFSFIHSSGCVCRPKPSTPTQSQSPASAGATIQPMSPQQQPPPKLHATIH